MALIAVSIILFSYCCLFRGQNYEFIFNYGVIMALKVEKAGEDEAFFPSFIILHPPHSNYAFFFFFHAFVLSAFAISCAKVT
ncbi:MAG: hypothetical protein J5545_08835 [Bacteroidaceae bacterium]|nr:hypothetical protein [Bacteroidaceae bacterium]